MTPRSGLVRRTWDVAIDVNGYLPLAVANSTRALAGAVGLYCFVSTVSVYDVDDPAMNGSASQSWHCHACTVCCTQLNLSQ